MPKAEVTNTTSQARRGAVPFDTLTPAIDRLKAIAVASGDALLTEGPVHPDHVLLALCHEIAEKRKAADAIAKECRRAGPMNRELHEAWKKAEHANSPLLRRAGELRATTPAGIYAKALAVRASVTGAAHLGRSLAEDLIACEGLRASLWPAVGED